MNDLSPKWFPSAEAAWREVLDYAITGAPVSPRGRSTRERLHASIGFEMVRPVVVCSARKLNYKFAAAEALWILEGRDDVAGVALWNARIAEFSDDGVVFAGAYGPRITEQLDYVVEALVRDGNTRQAVLTIWRPNPEPSKDIPCTVALTYSVRATKLHTHVFMRSSDVWLGWPYDVFNFTCLAARIASRVNASVPSERRVTLGSLFFTAASLHLYEDDVEKALPIVRGAVPYQLPERAVFNREVDWRTNEEALLRRLHEVREGRTKMIGIPL